MRKFISLISFLLILSLFILPIIFANILFSNALKNNSLIKINDTYFCPANRVDEKYNSMLIIKSKKDINKDDIIIFADYINQSSYNNATCKMIMGKVLSLESNNALVDVVIDGHKTNISINKNVALGTIIKEVDYLGYIFNFLISTKALIFMGVIPCIICTIIISIILSPSKSNKIAFKILDMRIFKTYYDDLELKPQQQKDSTESKIENTPEIFDYDANSDTVVLPAKLSADEIVKLYRAQKEHQKANKTTNNDTMVKLYYDNDISNYKNSDI